MRTQQKPPERSQLPTCAKRFRRRNNSYNRVLEEAAAKLAKEGDEEGARIVRSLMRNPVAQ